MLLKSVRDVIQERNELLIKMAFTSNKDKVKDLRNRIEALDHDIRNLTLKLR